MAKKITQEKVIVRPLQKVAYIDDDPDVLGLLKKYSAEFAEVEPEFFNDALAAFKVLKKRAAEFSVVVLDWNMPQMDGLEILRKIKENPDARYTQFLMMTSRTGESDIRIGLDAGAFYYLKKPVEKSFFKTILKSALQTATHLNELRKEAKEYSGASQLMNQGSFFIRTPDECGHIAAWLSRGCPDPVAANLGLNEIIINAIEHGNLEITYDEKTNLMTKDGLKEEIEKRLLDPVLGQRRVKVNFIRTEDTIEFEITDEGSGFDYEYYLTFTPERAFDNHGRGIVMAKNLYFTDLKFVPPGNKVIATIKLK